MPTEDVYDMLQEVSEMNATITTVANELRESESDDSTRMAYVLDGVSRKLSEWHDALLEVCTN